MTNLLIQTGDDNEILRSKSIPVGKPDKRVKKLIRDMADTLASAKGLGLAAPQVGENIRVILVVLNHGTLQEMVVPLINPEIIWTSSETCVGEEGCLSLPEQYDNVERFKRIRVKFLDIKGNENILELEDLNARIVQHEIDHLDGILFVDRVVKRGESCEEDTHFAL